MFGEKHEIERLREAVLELVRAVHQLSREQRELIEALKPKYLKTSAISVKVS